MSLDFSLTRSQPTQVYERNITHNLGAMAREAGVYQALWRPEELPVGTTAADLIPILDAGLALLEADEARFRVFDAPNGWGTYEHLVDFVRDTLAACHAYPDATPHADR